MLKKNWDAMHQFIGKGTIWVLAQVPLLVVAFALPSVIPPTILPWSSVTYLCRITLGILLGVSGLVLIILGLVRLGHNLTPFPRPKATGALVTTGIYGLVRHPIYGGLELWRKKT